MRQRIEVEEGILTWKTYQVENKKKWAAKSTVWHVRERRDPLAGSSTPNVLEDQSQRQNCMITASQAETRNRKVVWPSCENFKTRLGSRRWLRVTLRVELGHMMARPLTNVVGRRTVKRYTFCSGSATVLLLQIDALPKHEPTHNLLPF